MKIQVFVVLAIALSLPASVCGQCQESFGDYQVADGGLISDEYSAVDSCRIDDCSTICRGPYISIFGGLARLQDQHSDNSERIGDFRRPQDIEIGFEDGFSLGTAIGKRWNRNFRTEFEYVYRENDADRLISTASFIFVARNAVAAGETRSHAGMFNGYLDLPISNGVLTPYLGVGLGVTGIESDVSMESPPAPRSSFRASLDDNDSSFAAQWMVGLTYRTFGNAELFVEYRYFEAIDPQFTYREDFFEFDFGGTIIAVLDSEYVSKDVVFGIRMNF